MTPEERELISGLFDRLAQADTQPKDPEADQLIRQKVAAAPSSAYLLTQSALVMEHALTNAQSRIAALEEQLTEARASAARPSGGSFLSGLFGGGSQQPQPPPLPTRPAAPSYASAPAGVPLSGGSSSGGGGFLQTALSTAAGVAGGALLFQGIESLMGHNPGPFAGAAMPSGGVLGEPTEVVNNYYEDSGTGTGADLRDGGATAADLGLANDPSNPDDSFSNTGDFLSDNDTGNLDDSGGNFDDSGSDWS